jgi:hypothetical protein
MSPEEEYQRYIKHLRSTYAEALHDPDTQKQFVKQVKSKLDSMVSVGRLDSHTFTGIDFVNERFSFEVVSRDGSENTVEFDIPVNYYHGRTYPDDVFSHGG